MVHGVVVGAGGTGVFVGPPGVLVGCAGVLVGNTGVLVGSTGVLVAGGTVGVLTTHGVTLDAEPGLKRIAMLSPTMPIQLRPNWMPSVPVAFSIPSVAL